MDLNRRKSYIFLILFIFNITACNHDFNKLSLIAEDFVMDNIITNEEQVLVLKTIDYFSTAYPYTPLKVEEFFNTTLTSIPSPNFPVGYVNPNLSEYVDKSDKNNLEKIKMRSFEENGQELELIYRIPICFKTDAFLQKMEDDGYTLLIEPPELPSYNKIMDEENNIGTLGLDYTFINNKENICISKLYFNSRILFDRSRFVKE